MLFFATLVTGYWLATSLVATSVLYGAFLPRNS